MDSSIQKKLDLLRDQFAKNLPSRIAEIEALWMVLQEDWDKPKLEDLHRKFHNLKGSSATFGFSTLSSIAGQLEDIFSLLLQNETLLTPAEKANINNLINQLKSL